MPLPQKRPAGAVPPQSPVRPPLPKEPPMPMRPPVPPQPPYPSPQQPIQRQPHPAAPVPPQPVVPQPVDDNDGMDDMSFDFDDDGFAMSNEPMNPAAPTRIPANQDYLARRQNELSPNARNPFAVPDAKQDDFIPQPPQPVAAYVPPQEDKDEPTIADADNADSNTSSVDDGGKNRKPKKGAKPDRKPSHRKTALTVDNDGNAAMPVGADSGADLGAVSVGLASSVVAFAIILLGLILSIQSENWSIAKYAVLGAVAGLPVLALIAAATALLKKQGSRIAAIVGVVLSVFTLAVGGYAYAQAAPLSENLQKQVSQKIMTAVMGSFAGSMSSSSDKHDGSSSDKDKKYAITQEPTPGVSDEKNSVGSESSSTSSTSSDGNTNADANTDTDADSAQQQSADADTDGNASTDDAATMDLSHPATPTTPSDGK